MKDKKWETPPVLKGKNNQERIGQLVKILLNRRNLKTSKEVEAFLNPTLSFLSNPQKVGLSKKDLTQAVKRIKQAIQDKEEIVVFGDFDVDGVCSTAILWEVLFELKAPVLPYIPHRVDEGYGLSKKGIDNLLQSSKKKPTLLITVDNGISANSAISYAQKKGMEVIVTDHHQKSKKLPNADYIIWTDQLCGAAIAYVLAKQLQKTEKELNSLDLVAIATISDMQNLSSPNRALVKFGLEKLNQTKRPGILALLNETTLKLGDIGTYEVSHILGPRLNAMGRMEHALDSLRILCTNDPLRAMELARLLSQTNQKRQKLTEQTFGEAKIISRQMIDQKIIVAASQNWSQGIIGLVASRLVEEYARPVVVISQGREYSKGSARSIKGFNIVQTMQQCADILEGIGGHPMACGFTIATEKIALFRKKLNQLAVDTMTNEDSSFMLTIDCELNLADINLNLFDQIQKFAPFGQGNSEPTFLARHVLISDFRTVGIDGKHLKLTVSDPVSYTSFDAIAFGAGENSSTIKINQQADIVFTVARDSWNGREKLQLKVKDFNLNQSDVK